MACKIIMVCNGNKSAIKVDRHNGIRLLYSIDNCGPVMQTTMGNAPMPVHENGVIST